jgi:hypothetical protein
MPMISALLNFARGMRRSSGFKRAIATPKRLKIRLQQKLNRGIFSVELHTNAGFFASMQTIVFILVYCRENSLYPDISAKGGTYGEKTGTVDWFNGLFESIQKPAPSIADRLAQRTTIRTSIIKDEGELGFRSQYDARLSLVEASALFNGRYRPSAAVHAEVQAIAGKIGISRSTLAVHYRGTDKVSEAGVAPWSQVCARVAAVAANSPWLTKIFLATDELAFGEYFMNWAFKVPVIAAPAEYMPVGNRPVHFSGHPGLAIGREALVTCLLLARCGFLVKTASYLSGWAKIFNPELPVLLLAPQIGARFFPDRALWNDQQSARESTADPAHPPLRRYFPW